MALGCRVRYSAHVAGCWVRLVRGLDVTGEGKKRDLLRVVFDPQPAIGVTPGQFAVFYMGEFCLGGGPILRSFPTYFELGKPVPPSLRLSSEENGQQQQ